MLFQFLEAEADLATSVNHSVTVGAQYSKIGTGVSSSGSGLCKWYHVMDLGISGPDLSISFLKFKTARHAGEAVHG